MGKNDPSNKKPKKKLSRKEDPRFNDEPPALRSSTNAKRAARGLPPFNEKILQNLHCWRPGQSGNPAGMRKGLVSLTSAIRRALLEKNPITKRKKVDGIARVIVGRALTGDPDCIKIILDRTEGKAPDANTQFLVANMLGDFFEQFDQAIDIIVADKPTQKKLHEYIGETVGADDTSETYSPAIATLELEDDDSSPEDDLSKKQSVAVHKAIIHHPASTFAHKLKAQEQLDRISGVIGPDATGISAEEHAEKLQECVREIKERGGPPHPPDPSSGEADESVAEILHRSRHVARSPRRRRGAYKRKPRGKK